MPSFSRESKGGGLAKLGSLWPPSEPRGCTQAGRGAAVCLPCLCVPALPVCAGTEGTGASPSARGSPGGADGLRRRVSIEAGAKPRGATARAFLILSRGGMTAFPNLANTKPLWKEEKLSRERDRHGNPAELTRLAWRGNA